MSMLAVPANFPSGILQKILLLILLLHFSLLYIFRDGEAAVLHSTKGWVVCSPICFEWVHDRLCRVKRCKKLAFETLETFFFSMFQLNILERLEINCTKAAV